MPISLSSKNIIWFIQCIKQFIRNWGKQPSQVVLVVKNPPANAGDIRYVGSIPRSQGQEDPREEELANPYSILAWRIPWTEDPGRLHGKWQFESLESLSNNSMIEISTTFFFFLADNMGRLGEGNGTPLQYSCLESPMDRGAR